VDQEFCSPFASGSGICLGFMLTQPEADFLHALEKQFDSAEVLPFALSRAFDFERDLLSADRREKFILIIECGRRRRARLAATAGACHPRRTAAQTDLDGDGDGGVI
jgi:hypothetical protein